MANAVSVPRPRPGSAAQALWWRVLFAIFLTGIGAFLHSLRAADASGQGLGTALAVLYLSLGAASFGVRWDMPRRPLLTAQFVADAICTALVVLFCGGTGTALPLLFVVPIVLAAVYLGPRPALKIAIGASLFTSVLVLRTALDRPADVIDPQRDSSLLVGVIQVATFLVTGILSADLARRFSRRTRMQDRTEALVHKARSEVRSILDNLGSGLIAVDGDGMVTRINIAAGTVLGLDAESVVGHPLDSSLGAECAALTECILDVARGGRPRNRDEVVVDVGTRELPLGVSVNTLETSVGKREGAIAIFSDLSDVRRMQDRVRKADRLAGVGELAASIAHEIRNPLASIRGSVEILASELDLAGHQSQLLELILKESARVNTIITDFLSFARLRPAAPRTVCCRELVDDVALQIQQHIKVHGNNVNLTHWSVPENLRLNVDPEQMIQLFLNLAINACEAMEYHGELLVSVEATENHEYCELKVVDNGPGIDPDRADELFTPFVTTKKGGTGLGLPMVVRIARAHGGGVEVDAAPSGGTVFTVRLPLQLPFPDASSPGDEPVWSLAPQADPRRSSETIDVS